MLGNSHYLTSKYSKGQESQKQHRTALKIDTQTYRIEWKIFK